MNASWTEEQDLMRRTVREFARKVIAPVADELDLEGRFPLDIVAQMAQMDLMGIPVPVELGGAGSSFMSYVIAIEELARGSAAVAIIVAVHTSVGTFSILYFGNEKQRKNLVPRLASGEILGAFALTEPQAGSDAASIRTTAKLNGDHYLLNGSKMFITNAGYAGVYTLLAVTGRSQGSNSISAFLLEPETPGLRIGPPERKMGLNASCTCPLFLENAVVPRENLLGQEGDGFKIAMGLLDGGRIGIGAQAVGISSAALEMAISYARQREQFGRAIAHFEGIQFMLADMATEREAARLLVYRAADLKDRGLPHGKEASMAKMFATDTAMRVTTDAVQVFGGYGYMRDYGVERLMRDAKATQIYEGTNQIQRLVIARHVLGNNLLRPSIQT